MSYMEFDAFARSGFGCVLYRKRKVNLGGFLHPMCRDIRLELALVENLFVAERFHMRDELEAAWTTNVRIT